MQTKEAVLTRKPQKKYKDRLFRMLFSERKDLLELYNALCQKNYTDPDALEITTLDDVIYMGMKNDISFLLDGRMGLFEHQSTFNPNMPLRGLFYFSDLYKRFFHDRLLYSSRLLKIPTPVYVVFYNGEQKLPDTSILKLSDAFMQGEDMACLEVRVRMLNINEGHNADLMKRCRKLEEYALFTGHVRENLKTMEPAEAICRAMDMCIEKGVLAGFLSRRRAEIMNALLTEYDEEKVMKSLSKEFYEDGYEAGKEEGQKKGRKEGRKEGLSEGIRAFVKYNLKEGKNREQIIDEIIKVFSLNRKQADKYFTDFSKIPVSKSMHSDT